MSSQTDIVGIINSLRDVHRDGAAADPYRELVFDVVQDPERATVVIAALAGLVGGAMDSLARVTNRDPDVVLDGLLFAMLDQGSS